MIIGLLMFKDEKIRFYRLILTENADITN